MTVNERIRLFIKTDGQFNVKQVEDKIGKKNGYIRNTENYSMDVIYGFATVYPNLNLRWLFTGKGEMRSKADPPKQPLGANSDKIDARLQAIEDHVALMNSFLHELIKIEAEGNPAHSKILKVLAKLDNERKKKNTGILSK